MIAREKLRQLLSSLNRIDGMPSGPLLDFGFSLLIERITSPSPIEIVSKMQSRAMAGQVRV